MHTHTHTRVYVYIYTYVGYIYILRRCARSWLTTGRGLSRSAAQRSILDDPIPQQRRCFVHGQSRRDS